MLLKIWYIFLRDWMKIHLCKTWMSYLCSISSYASKKCTLKLLCTYSKVCPSHLEFIHSTKYLNLVSFRPSLKGLVSSEPFSEYVREKYLHLARQNGCDPSVGDAGVVSVTAASYSSKLQDLRIVFASNGMKYCLSADIHVALLRAFSVLMLCFTQQWEFVVRYIIGIFVIRKANSASHILTLDNKI